jgi:O-antigen ligase
MVPSAVWTRMEFSVEGDTDQLDSRSFLYSMAMQTYAEYALMGVGSGNSEAALGDWSTGVHNSFIQITINWGLIGLLSFVLMLWHAYKCLPMEHPQDHLALAVIGVVTATFFMLFFIHNFHEKFFSVAIGMLVASRCWLWPVDAYSVKPS